NDGNVYSSGFAEVGDGGNGDSQFMPNSKVYSCYNDSGSFSRYYDLDKWWEERIKSLPESVREVFPFLITPKAAKSEKNFGCDSIEEKHNRRDDGQPYGMNTNEFRPDGSRRKEVQAKKNHHPTVKP